MNTNLSKYCFALMVVFHSNSYAGFFEQLGTELQKAVANELPKSFGAENSTSGQYCDVLTNSAEINEIAKYKKRLIEEHGVKYTVDTNDLQLSNFVYRKLSSLYQRSLTEFSSKTSAQEISINKCLVKNRDSDIVYLFVNNKEEYVSLKNKIENIDKPSKSGFYNRSIIGDYSGNARAVDWVGKAQTFGLPPEWIIGWTVMLDPSLNELRKVFPQLVEPMKSALVTLDKDKNERLAREANEKKENEARAAVIAEKNKKRNDFGKTSEGKLIEFYKIFQMVQTCHEMRKDYAVQFISVSDYIDSQKRMRAIENHFKPTLKTKTTDELWRMAEVEIRGADIFSDSEKNLGLDNLRLDVITILKEQNRRSPEKAREACVEVQEAFIFATDKQLGQKGKPPISKNF